MREALVASCAIALCGGCGGDDAAASHPDAAVDASIDAPTDAPPDPCDTHTCECTVATEHADCGAHEYCNVDAVSRTCACVAGYADVGGGCAWVGTVKDIGFAAPDKWTVAS